MRYLYFVKFEKEAAENSREALKKAKEILEENSFAFQDGYWGGGRCDWYQIGGAWSGVLSGLDIKGDFRAEAYKLVRGNEPIRGTGGRLSTEEAKKHADEIQKLWVSLGGKNINPYARDQYADKGMDDDAMILTAEAIKALNEKYGDVIEYFDSDSPEERKISALSGADVGDWLVALDCHI